MLREREYNLFYQLMKLKIFFNAGWRDFFVCALNMNQTDNDNDPALE
jgi:hypothetical protein